MKEFQTDSCNALLGDAYNCTDYAKANQVAINALELHRNDEC